MSRGSINVVDVVDRNRLTPSQLIVFLLCGLCMIMDGFDVQAMGYVAPALIRDWQISKAALGPVFGAGLFGIMVGSLVLGIVADKVGRRPVLIAATLFIAFCTLLTAYASSVSELLALRFIAGLGMGAIIPNAMALTGEFSPARIRVTSMMLVSSGFIIGGAIGGGVASALIPIFGWRSVFYAGAIAPAAVAAVMMIALPESLEFLVSRRRHLDKVRSWINRLDPQAEATPEIEFVVPERGRRGMPVTNLFRDGMATGTLLLWIINFMNLLCAYFLANWLPVLMNEAGHSAAQAVMAGTLLWVGGIVGNLLLGWLVDRRGFGPVLSTALFVAGIAIVAIGQVHGSLILALIAIGVAGFCVLGVQSGLNALGPTYYPVAMRSTGTGWASGIGRFGSIFGPVVGGELIRLEWATSDLFFVAAVPALLGTASMLTFWRMVPLTRVGADAASLSQGQPSVNVQVG
jgi:AAHS family 4-hydroxybenzoate transporter-like MFS transporter